MKKNMPQGVCLPSSLLINPNKEDLRIVLKPYMGITHIPSDLDPGSPQLMVFIELNKCFKKAGFVAEGMLANVIWGFEQCGYDNRHVAAGLSKLRQLDYICYSDSAGFPIHDLIFDEAKPIWIKYTDKFKRLFSSIEGAPTPQGGVAI